MSPDRDSADWLERRLAVKAAKEDHDVLFLLSALTDLDHRGLAAQALGELGASEAIPHLMKLLEASDRSVRIDGIRALGQLGASEATPRLREIASSDADATVRSWACGALADLGDGSAVELAIPLLKESLITVRGSAALTLGQLGDPRALKALRKARPRIYRSPVEWWAYRHTYRDAISVLERRAAGKAPRHWTQARWFRRLRTYAWVGALAAIAGLLWFYAGFWWSFWFVAALVGSWLFVLILFIRRLPLD